MFKDYYQILGIPFGSSSESIKKSYRKQSLKWHPDKHPEMDVTCKMQDINEAYAILKDIKAKNRYDTEYLRFLKLHGKTASQGPNSNMSDNTDPDYHASNSNQNHYQYYYNYTVHDETLNEDISKAHAFAKKLVEEFFSELKRNSKLAIKGAWGEVAGYLIGFIVLFIISLILGLCIH